MKRWRWLLLVVAVITVLLYAIHGNGGGVTRVSDPRIVSMAQNWANNLAATGILAHNPNLAAQSPPGWGIIGENVGVGSSVAVIEAAFRASPEHLKNLLDPRFTRWGVAVATSTDGRVWEVQDFWGGVVGVPVTIPVPRVQLRPPSSPHPPVTPLPFTKADGIRVWRGIYVFFQWLYAVQHGGQIYVG